MSSLDRSIWYSKFSSSKKQIKLYNITLVGNTSLQNLQERIWKGNSYQPESEVLDIPKEVPPGNPKFTNAYPYHHIASPFTEKNQPHNSKNTSDRKIWFTAFRNQITLQTLQKPQTQIPRIHAARGTIDLDAHHKIIIHKTS